MAQTPVPTNGADIEFFEKHVRPILVERCYECHAADEASGGFRLDDREAVIRGGDTGKAVVPGKPDESLLIKAVRYRDQDLQMPPKGILNSAEIEALEKWVTMGAPDPREPKTSEPQHKSLGLSIAEGREFWSMKPIANIPLPHCSDPNWVVTPIDAFVLAKLDALQLAPAPEADRRTLLRRLTHDLLGVPPTNEELDAFEADLSPDAYERCIDRLLSSPQYGVRWGRHWLDVARYADSNGLDENIAYGNAWRYRDYVVQAFNKDKPIDRFIQEQIAGDLLDHADSESITGTGFLVLGAKVLAEPDREKLNMDTIDEQLDTIGKAFLGMTLGCVRCHDHKFDPIVQRDYYSLAAIFKGTKTFGDTNFGAIKHWHEVSFASEAEKSKLKEVNAKIAEKQAAWNSTKSTAMNALRERAKKDAAKYLAAAVRLPEGASLSQCESIATPAELHPRVLYHCRKHLQFHREDPLFTRWHELAASNDEAGVLNYYSVLFQDASAAWEAAKKADDKITKLSDERLETARQALQDPSGFVAIPAKMEHALDEATIASLHASANELRIFESNAPDETAVMGVAEGEVSPTMAIHIRGNHRSFGDVVERNFPAVFQSENAKPVFSRKGSGRLEFAQWLTSPSNPLTARVFVNRIWRWHFGRGIVASTENFGKLGDRPTHPELLDFLSRNLIESGWSMKEMHRMILRSNSYRMSSTHPDAELAMAIDPENQYLWRFQPQRLDAEQIRDSILSVSGLLDWQLSGKSVPLRNRQFVFDHTSIDHTRYDSLRRAAYLPIIRNHLYSHFEQFDFPDPTMPSGNRQSTTVAPQALLLMNADWVILASRKLAANSARVAVDNASRAEWLFRQTLLREPTRDELTSALRFVQSLTKESDPASKDIAWSLLCQNLLICNEFFFVK